MSTLRINPVTGRLDLVGSGAGGSGSADSADLIDIRLNATGGYEFTGGFADRDSGTAGATDIGTNVEYTADMAANNRWLRFGLTSDKQLVNDQPYWSDGPDSDEAPHSGTTNYQGVGLFSGAYMPEGVTSMFAFSEDTEYNDALDSGDFQYTQALGSLDFSQCKVGDLAEVRFDFNIVPQSPNTEIEVGLIWATRDDSDNVTFTFALTTQPIFVGSGQGQAFLARPTISAYFASQEDVNARALPAIRSNQPVFIQPLTCLTTIRR